MTRPPQTRREHEIEVIATILRLRKDASATPYETAEAIVDALSMSPWEEDPIRRNLMVGVKGVKGAEA